MKSLIGEVRSHKYQHLKATPEGGEFETVENIIRVMGADEYEIFYDVWLQHSQSWSLLEAKNCTYYRFARDYFLNNTTFMRAEPLTEKELSFHRPDLPNRCCQIDNWRWNRDYFGCQNLFDNEVGLNEPASKIMASELVIIPRGPKGAAKKGVTVDADNGHFFYENELLLKAHNIQSKWGTNAIDVVGIYRSGITRGLPSFYLGEKYDDAGNCKPRE